MKQLLSIVFLFFLFNVSAQLNTLPSKELFKKAKSEIKEKKYKEARGILRILCERKPKEVKYRLKIATTYLWEKNFPKTQKYVGKVLNIDPKNKQAFEIWFKSFLWQKDYEKGGAVLDSALKFYPEDEYFLFQKAKILVKQEDKEGAIKLLDKLLIINPNHKEGFELRKELKAETAINRIGLSYLYNFYSQNASNPLHGMNLRYIRRTKYGSIHLFNNNARRFQKLGHQIELDAYPRIIKGLYSYVNFGASRTSLFPKYRAGLEPFFKLPRSFEGSLGGRYLQFSNSSVLMYTGSIAKYIKSSWINLRTFITPKEVSFSRSVSLEYRKYKQDANNFYSIRVGYGASPDNNALNANLETVLFTPSYKLALAVNKTLKGRWYFRCSVSGERQVLETGFNNLLSLNTHLDYAF